MAKQTLKQETLKLADETRRRVAKLKLAELRMERLEIQARARSELGQARYRCAASLARIRERRAALSRQAADALRAEIARLTAPSKRACAQRIEEIKARSMRKVNAIKAIERAERAHQRAVDRATKRAARTGRTAYRRETDAEVEAQLSAELIPLWRRVRRTLKGSRLISRSEQFAQWLEEHPEELAEQLSASAESAVEDELEDVQARIDLLWKLLEQERITPAQLKRAGVSPAECAAAGHDCASGQGLSRYLESGTFRPEGDL